MSTQNVKLNTSFVGNYVKDGKPSGIFSYKPGDVVELPQDEAKRFIAKGYASPVNSK
jgi:hypothetical protein